MALGSDHAHLRARRAAATLPPAVDAGGASEFTGSQWAHLRARRVVATIPPPVIDRGQQYGHLRARRATAAGGPGVATASRGDQYGHIRARRVVASFGATPNAIVNASRGEQYGHIRARRYAGTLGADVIAGATGGYWWRPIRRRLWREYEDAQPVPQPAAAERKPEPSRPVVSAKRLARLDAVTRDLERELRDDAARLLRIRVEAEQAAQRLAALRALEQADAALLAELAQAEAELRLVEAWAAQTVTDIDVAWVAFVMAGD